MLRFAVVGSAILVFDLLFPSQFFSHLSHTHTHKSKYATHTKPLALGITTLLACQELRRQKSVATQRRSSSPRMKQTSRHIDQLQILCPVICKLNVPPNSSILSSKCKIIDFCKYQGMVYNICIKYADYRYFAGRMNICMLLEIVCNAISLT